jgi:hypothetical protein
MTVAVSRRRRGFRPRLGSLIAEMLAERHRGFYFALMASAWVGTGGSGMNEPAGHTCRMAVAQRQRRAGISKDMVASTDEAVVVSRGDGATGTSSRMPSS